MIDHYLLEELVTFQRTGTLAATAQALQVTQPTITRGMQKLEADLGVKIFERHPNRISLTQTGIFAAQAAQKVLAQNKAFIETVQKYDYNHQNINIGAVAPGPLILLSHLQTKVLTQPKIAIDTELLAPKAVLPSLLAHDHALILTNQELMTDAVESPFIGVERLSVNLNQFTLLANKKTVTFSELRGLSFIVLSDIGVWKQVAENQIPEAKFLYQDQQEAFAEITKYSDFPYFSTNISKFHQPQIFTDHNQVNVPISDDLAGMTFYAAYLKENKKLVTPIVKAMATEWQAELT